MLPIAQAFKRIIRVGWPALALVGIFLLAGIFAPVIAPYDPSAQDLMMSNEGMSWAHLLGTDNLGRDTASRLLMGAQTTLFAVTTVVILALMIGVTIGSIAGFVGGIVDEVIMRFVDFGLSIPSNIVALSVIGVFGPSYGNMIIALTIAWVPSYARLSRATVAATVHQPHIESLWVLGASNTRILCRHLIPTAVAAVLVYASADAGILALTIATLSFLGLGVQPPMAEWGQMLVDALPYIEESPRQVILPGIALTIMVTGFNLLGEGLALAKAPRRLSWKLLRLRREVVAKEVNA
ncbi:ABC transporter permease [Sinorhizobium mexicanum]|uniref:ABC transporter permease subunit n=1 Tax=Sinorhizobium mexicanum TaxID=375549 RepID=A0A859QKW9_9HYPH|nr:ABC transporter permease subunit [Sinorhizobium mexicanum]MBP1886490.1 peptide/nickel transport system permease protein [Sinorhizobium mexicanum]QLL63935.1 ABC transporter permease subunit [Sinorhizobium mexicanum]